MIHYVKELKITLMTIVVTSTEWVRELSKVFEFLRHSMTRWWTCIFRLGVKSESTGDSADQILNKTLWRPAGHLASWAREVVVQAHGELTVTFAQLMRTRVAS